MQEGVEIDGTRKDDQICMGWIRQILEDSLKESNLERIWIGIVRLLFENLEKFRK